MSKTIFLEAHNLNNPFSGFGSFNYHLINALEANKPSDIEFVVNTPSIKQSNLLFDNKVTLSKNYGFNRYPLFYKRKKYDLWHSLNQNTKIETYYKLPYVLTVHDVNFVHEISNDKTHPRNIRFIEKLKRAHAITYISEFAKKETHLYFKVPSIPEFVIHNGNPIIELLDTSNFNSKFSIKKPFLFSLGDFFERKNYHTIIKMMPFLKDYTLVISGNNSRSYGSFIQKLILELKLENQVFLTGKISDLEKQYFYENCEAFLFPSIREGFGLPPIEAMRFKKPVFLSTLTSLPEIGGNASFYWENFDPVYMSQLFLEKMKVFNSNKAHYEKLLYEQSLRFDWNRSAKQYLEVYESVL